LGSLPVATGAVPFVCHGTSIQKLDWLSRTIAVVILITAIGLLIAPNLLSLARADRIEHPREFKARLPQLTVVAGAILGLSVAMISIGAGATGSVMLLYLYPLRLTPHNLVATDIAHAIPLAIVAGLGYLFAGLVDQKMLVSLLAASVPSVVVGSVLMRLCPPRMLQILLAGVLLLAGVKMLL